MIILLTTAVARYTHQPFVRSSALRFRVMPYQRLFERRRLPRATYVFTDLDRLHFWDLEWAGRIFRHLAAHGVRVLNDPARFRSRYQLLSQLHREGINSFNVWHATESPPEHVYPVFLRTDSAHRGPLTGLLRGPQALAAAVEQAVAGGVPLRELMIVQYAAEPVAENLYRKLSCYRVGERFIGGLCAHQDDWVAKFGKIGIATAELYDEEFRIVRDNPYEEFARKVFATAENDYGRLDFALVEGRPVAYEVNTNPHVGALLREHPFPIRLEAAALVQRQLTEAFQNIDTAEGGSVPAMPEQRTLGGRLREVLLLHRLSRQARMP